MTDSGKATAADQSEASESQDKTFDIYFGVFFDVREVDHWVNTVGNYRKKGEKFKSDMENKVQDNKYYKMAEIAEDITKSIMEQLPNNPVSNAIQKGLDAKDKVVGYKDKAEGYVDKVTGYVDNKSNKVLDNGVVNIDDDFDPLGSKHSIISLMEPVYQGGGQQQNMSLAEGTFTYAYRVYAQGSVYAEDFKEKKSDNEEGSSEAETSNTGLAEKAADDALKDISDYMVATPSGKISVHFDLFGYAKDDAVNILESKLNGLKSEHSKIQELKVDYKGQYTKFNDPDEVKGSLGGTKDRFRNTKFLDK